MCSSANLKCVENVKTSSTTCLKACSGLFITSLTKTDPPKTDEEKKKFEEKVFHRFAEAYRMYKKLTKKPNWYQGRQFRC